MKNSWKKLLRITLLIVGALGQQAIQANMPSSEALSALHMEQYETASAVLEKSLAEFPGDADLQAALTEAYWRSGRLKAAQESAEKLIELRQDRAQDYYLLGRVLAERVNDVSIFKKLSYAGRIRKAFEQCIQLDPQHVKGLIALVAYHVSAPGIAGGDRDAAEQLVQQLKAVSEVAALRAEMLLLFADEKDEDAFAKAATLLERKPGDVSTLFYLAVLEMNQKNYAMAVNYINQVGQADDLDQRQQLRMLWYALGKAAGESGMWLDEGRAALERYLDLQSFRSLPSKAWAYYRLGIIYQQMKDENQSWRYLELAEQENKTQDDDDLADLLKLQRKKRRAG